MTNAMKNFILDAHNEYRNKIASSHLIPFPHASRMRKMYWNQELAFLAKVHVEKCIFAHDACRISKQYDYPGQNIAVRWYSHKEEDYLSVLQKMMEQWWDEWKLVGPADNAIQSVESLRFT